MVNSVERTHLIYTFLNMPFTQRGARPTANVGIYNDVAGTQNNTTLNSADRVNGDKISGDKVNGDKFWGDKVGGNKSVYQGEKMYQILGHSLPYAYRKTEDPHHFSPQESEAERNPVPHQTTVS